MFSFRMGTGYKATKIILAVLAVVVLLGACVFLGMGNAVLAFAEPEPNDTTYKITFLDYDGTEFYSADVAEGETPVCVGTPTKPTDTFYQYTFDDWADGAVKGIVPATKETYYIPVFNSAPSVWTFGVSASDTDVTYGEIVTLQADYGANCILNPNMECSFSWMKDNKLLSQTSSSIKIYDVAESGKYTLTIDYKDYSGASCSASADVTVTISPLPVAVNWSAENEVTYNGATVTPTATATGVLVTKDGAGEPIVENDYALELVLDGGKDVLPRDYIAKATVASNNYTLTNNFKAYRIVPMEVAVVWGAQEVQYSGNVECRTATATGANGESIKLEFNGGGSEPNETYYVSVFTYNENYTLTNTESEFFIIKRTVVAEWQLNNTYTYTGENQIDAVAAVFNDGTGVLRRLKVTFDTLDKNDQSSFINAGTYKAYASLPDAYIPYYTLSSDSVLTKTVQMVKATPRIVVNHTSMHYVFDGEPKAVEATISSGEDIVYVVDGKEVSNAFVQPGNYSVIVKSNESVNYLPAAEVEVSLIIDVVTTDSSGSVSGSIKNAGGISPTAKYALEDVTEARYADFEPKWSDDLVQVVDIVLSENGEEITPSGSSTVVIAVPEALKDETAVYINYAIGANNYKFATVQVEDGYITLTLDYLGEVAFYQSSVSGSNSITNIGSDSNIAGVIWWGAIAGVVLISVIVVAIYLSSRSKKIG